jgi:hypothetical protein
VDSKIFAGSDHGQDTVLLIRFPVMWWKTAKQKPRSKRPKKKNQPFYLAMFFDGFSSVKKIVEI